MIRKFTLLFFILGNFCAFAQYYYKYVNPMIGTDGTGHTFPGATTPFGMVQLSPDTRIDGSWEGCSGYHFSDNKIYGFSHTHLNGTGVSDYGDIMLMPTMGAQDITPEFYSSTFLKEKETASAGYYSVFLEEFQIQVELTASTRVGFHRYKFQNAGEALIVLDLHHRDLLLESDLVQIDDQTIEVYRKSSAWAHNQQI